MMRIVCLVCGLFLFIGKTQAQPASDSLLTVACWNIEWLGSRQNGPVNDALQQQNAGLVLPYLKADLYGLCEIVDTAVLGRLVRALPGNYGYVVSDFCSLAGSPIDADWAVGQKLAFVYNKAVFTQVRTRGLLRASGAAYSNWASGRYPFLFTANVRVNQQARAFHAILIHAKSGATNTDFNRRQAGAQELKDSIDQYFGQTALCIIGDYNDDLDQSIVLPLPSSYQMLVADSTDATSYKSLTLPLSLLGQKSTISFNDVIDHHMANASLARQYIPGSARIRTDVVAVVPGYNTRNTSDHYPVTAQFRITAADTIVAQNPGPQPPQPTQNTVQIRLLANPIFSRGELVFISTAPLANADIQVLNALGQPLLRTKLSIAQGPNSVRIPEATSGLHWLLIRHQNFTQIVPFISR